jgi:hypothetical protein
MPASHQYENYPMSTEDAPERLGMARYDCDQRDYKVATMERESQNMIHGSGARTQ